MQNSPARSHVEVGTVIDGTYIIEGVIGRGGMGAVYLANHSRLQGKKVAIKMLHADLGGEEILARFKREADIASQLDHPNIVKVENYDVFEDGTPYIVYEFLQGESLAQRLTAGPMAIDSVFSILRQIGSALGAAHRAGIVHRDHKPQNIFLIPSEVDGRAIEIAKVLDFGISKMRGSQTVKTQEATLLGTPQYMAPEQATGQHTNVDERTDVFALGAITYEMVSGQPAFSGANIPEVVFKVVYEQPRPLSEVAPSLADVLAMAINKAMAKVPAERYATVNDFVEAMTGSPISLVRKPKTSMVGAAAASPSQNLKNSSNDAFAQTMGSGDHGFSPVKPTLDMPGPASQAVDASAPTIDSQRGVPAPVPEIASARTVAAPVPAAPVATPPGNKRGVIAGIAIALVAVGGVAIYLATRGGGDDKPRKREHVAQRTDEPKPTPIPAPPPPPVHEATPVVPPPPIDKPPVEVKPKVKAPVKVDRPDDEAGDDTIKQKLADAEAAYRAGDLQKVERIANTVITDDRTSDGQKAHARALHGICMCVIHNSEDQARIDLRKLDSYPGFRAKLLKACRAENRLVNDR